MATTDARIVDDDSVIAATSSITSTNSHLSTNNPFNISLISEGDTPKATTVTHISPPFPSSSAEISTHAAPPSHLPLSSSPWASSTSFSPTKTSSIIKTSEISTTPSIKEKKPTATEPLIAATTNTSNTTITTNSSSTNMESIAATEPSEITNKNKTAPEITPMATTSKDTENTLKKETTATLSGGEIISGGTSINETVAQITPINIPTSSAAAHLMSNTMAATVVQPTIDQQMTATSSSMTNTTIAPPPSSFVFSTAYINKEQSTVTSTPTSPTTTTTTTTTATSPSHPTFPSLPPPPPTSSSILLISNSPKISQPSSPSPPQPSSSFSPSPSPSPAKSNSTTITHPSASPSVNASSNITQGSTPQNPSPRSLSHLSTSSLSSPRSPNTSTATAAGLADLPLKRSDMKRVSSRRLTKKGSLSGFEEAAMDIKIRMFALVLAAIIGYTVYLLSCRFHANKSKNNFPVLQPPGLLYPETSDYSYTSRPSNRSLYSDISSSYLHHGSSSNKEGKFDVPVYHLGQSPVKEKRVPDAVQAKAKNLGVDIIHQSMAHLTEREMFRPPRVVRLAILQTAPMEAEGFSLKDLHRRYSSLIDLAGAMGVKILSLEENWTIPYFASRPSSSSSSFHPQSHQHILLALSNESSTLAFIQGKAKEWGMVIVCPMIERGARSDVLETVVVVDQDGSILGRQRYNHPSYRRGSDDVMNVVPDGEVTHTVFETSHGSVGVVVGASRHYPLEWLTLGLKGAEVVINPFAATDPLSRSLWQSEATTYAIQNGLFVVSLNRAGFEEASPISLFSASSGPNTHPPSRHQPASSVASSGEPTSFEGVKGINDVGRGGIGTPQYFGSSFVTAPDGSRSQYLPFTREGLLIVDVDLNGARQSRDRSGYLSHGRYRQYAELLKGL